MNALMMYYNITYTEWHGGGANTIRSVIFAEEKTARMFIQNQLTPPSSRITNLKLTRVEELCIE